MVVSALDELNADGFQWDYLILDEGHRIKNPSRKGSRALHEVCTKHRLLLSGVYGRRQIPKPEAHICCLNRTCAALSVLPFDLL